MMSGTCRSCGGKMIGDGFSTPLRCENAGDELVDGREPDSSPIWCFSVLRFKRTGKKGQLLLVEATPRQSFRNAIVRARDTGKEGRGTCVQAFFVGALLQFSTILPTKTTNVKTADFTEASVAAWRRSLNDKWPDMPPQKQVIDEIQMFVPVTFEVLFEEDCEWSAEIEEAH